MSRYTTNNAGHRHALGEAEGRKLILWRQRRDIRLYLAVPDAGTAIHVLAEAAERVRRQRPRRLRLTTAADGRVRATTPTSGRSRPPYLKGRVTADGSGVFVEGVIHESRNESITPRLFAVLTVFMAAVCIGLLVGGQFANPGVYICGVAAVLFGVLAHALKALRPGAFAREADELVRRLRRDATVPFVPGE